MPDPTGGEEPGRRKESTAGRGGYGTHSQRAGDFAERNKLQNIHVVSRLRVKANYFQEKVYSRNNGKEITQHSTQ